VPDSPSLDQSGAPLALAFTEAGGGPPLLLLSGLGCDRDFWGAHVPLLAKKFRVIAPDGRGSGESPAPAGPYTAREMADDALGLLDRLGIGEASVAGHSLGGMVALEMALAAMSIPGARLEVVPGAGHNGVAEDPSLFCRTLEQFFSEG
jgi:pimeloyl-ACP methyl ester carboxylesterase